MQNVCNFLVVVLELYDRLVFNVLELYMTFIY